MWVASPGGGSFGIVRLEELNRGMLVEGVSPDEAVTLKNVESDGDGTVEVIFKDASGRIGERLLFRSDEPNLKVVREDGGWRFDGDGARFRLAAEARRIGSAYLFDPRLAVHTSLVDPYPHQISAVYERMLTRQPLRFLLADDPGAGKTIMAGLLIKELIARGDLERCMIVCPGSLVEQWQDELRSKFGLPFKIVAREQIESSMTGNPLAEEPLAICRLDHLARNEGVKETLKETEWDLIVADEAHKMSASFSGGEVSPTKRYQLGELLSGITRHFLLMTATPHNGKEEDFQLFMRLLDADRFERYFRGGRAKKVDTADVMRRMIKEDLKKFDGSDLFPPRVAHTVPFALSPAEHRLYEDVTDYVRNQFNRAERAADGRKRTVGFALTVLQRRLASDGALVTKWAPMMLKKELDAYLWRGEEHVSLKLVREDLAKYLYLPRLRDGRVLEETVREGVASGEFFGYAQAVTAAGRYEGLRFGEVGVTIYMDESSVLVHPEASRRQIEAESEQQTTVYPPGTGEEGGGGGEGGNGGAGVGGPDSITVDPPPVQAPERDLSRRFHGVVEIDPARLGGSAGAISQEVVQRLASIMGSDVRVTLEIRAEVPEGIPEKVERDVSENCNTLRFREHGFLRE